MGDILRREKIILFEPWGLGDLAISLNLARSAYEQGLDVTLLCNQRYAEWAKSFPFVSKVLSISVPWTQKTRKYKFLSYPWKEWLRLRSVLRKETFFAAIEPRRDPRAWALLKFLVPTHLKTPSSHSNGLGYERLKLFPQSTAQTTFAQNKSPPKVPSFICFFGAEWSNRRVPNWKIPSLIEAIRKSGANLEVIVPLENENLPFYADLEKSGITCIRGSIAEISDRTRSFSHCISTDSGWLHVAHLHGLKTLGLFGFENDLEWAPPGCVVIRSEHFLPARFRYRHSYEQMHPLGTLRIKSFSNAVDSLIR